MSVSNVIDFETSTGQPLTIPASAIEVIGDMNGWPFIRTKSGFQHLLRGDAVELRRRWRAALVADAKGTILTTIDIEPLRPKFLP